MNPFAIFSTLWAHKLLAIPLVLLIVGACGYAMFYGPRTYESSATYVLITPDTPSDLDIANNPALTAKTDNPYLRAPEPSLAAQVVMTRLGALDVAEALERDGLSTDYTALPASEFGSGQIIRVTASADTPEKAVNTTSRLGTLLTEELRSIQLVNGADEQYFMTAQEVTPPGAAVERLSSRLRNVAMLGVAGLVLLFGAVSAARALELRKSRRAPATEGAEDNGFEPADVPKSDFESTENHTSSNNLDGLLVKPNSNGRDVLSRSN
ncbi:hypothetical protein [Williamsia sp.]|uniref:hypothetical protein n=1 Tax=Williamsia sp. TaxID=1872085 RepID=UPI002F946F14